MTNYQSNTQVHGWLVDVPGYRENYRNQREIMNHDDSKQFVPSRKERPSSLASISSEDSVNLDELINANFTTDMDDETDLSALASLELDDSNEDFWKVDNVFNHYITTQLASTDKSRLKINNSNRSKYESEEEFDSKNTSAEDLHDISLYNNTTEHSFLDTLDLNSPADCDIKFSNMHLSSPPHRYRSDRSGSFSSDNSSNSQSTITTANRKTLHQNVYPSASTSTSSMSSHSTAKTSHSSFISRPSLTKSESNKTSNRLTCSRKPSLVSSISESTAVEAKPTLSSTTRFPSRSVSQIGLAKRATHIPAPSSSKATLSPIASTKLSPTPQRTKSTASIARKSSNTSLNRSASRIGQPNTRASHIPSPPTTKRSTTSLGISSIFSSSASGTQQQKQSNTQQQQKYHPQPSNMDKSRPNTSMGTLKLSSPPSTLRSGLRTPSLMRPPSSSKSISLKLSGSRSLYK
ncbi:unnamed protein product [Mucor fragilis]